MSIFGSWLHLSDDAHELGCATFLETSPGVYESVYRPCTCGQPDAPIGYQGSHILPSLSDRKGGALDIGAIPDLERVRDTLTAWLEREETA